MSDEADPTFLRRRAGFDGVAERYDAVRPHYPDGGAITKRYLAELVVARRS